MKKFVIILLLSIVNCQLSMAQIGRWKAYMAYHEVQQIKKAGDDLFVMASNDLYQYNLNDQSIYTYDKTNGLSDTHITHINWCPQAERLIVVYQNANIDLVERDGNVINISDLYQKVITGDKTVSSIRIAGPYAYLICGFGIVKVNVERAEIAESYTPKHPDYPTGLPDEDNSDYDKYIDLVSKLQPGGPESNHIGFLRFTGNKLYTCGGITGGRFDPGIPANVQVWDGSDWTIYQNHLESITGHDYLDLASVDVDPLDASHVFASGRTGLYEFRDGKFVKEYNYDNSPLKTTAAIDHPSKNYTMVQTVKYDREGSLWLLNSGSATTSLFEITKEGKWINHHHKEFQNTASRAYDNMVNAMFDSRGLLWFCNDRFVEPALLCYQPSTDGAVAYKTFTNQDGTTATSIYNVTAVVEDTDANLWIGTNVGPFVLEANAIFEDNPTFIQVKVPRNDGTDYADYLLSGIDITAIAIDGGGRKWFGTNGNGAYLISADNMTQVQHFTTTNSKLLSDVVQSIAIDPKSGEVFFGTDQGLCSYMSDATAPAETMDDDHVYAYPNPVDFSNYSGLITVTGLTFNADVKITNAAGFLVAEGRSNGGLFTWDGKDKKGNRVGSGVYHVITATSDGKKGTVCRIAIVK